MKKFEETKSLYNTMKNSIGKISGDDDFIISGITTDFDRLFELVWKTLKEYMYSILGIKAAKTGSPKMIIRMAYAEGLIDHEDIWIKLIKDRNDDTHIYQESAARAYASRIVRDYMPFMENFIAEMSEVIPEDDNAVVKIPKSFVDAARRSGMYYDEFLDSVIQKHHFSDEIELFRNWDKIKCEYDNNSTEKLSFF